MRYAACRHCLHHPQLFFYLQILEELLHLSVEELQAMFGHHSLVHITKSTLSNHAVPKIEFQLAYLKKISYLYNQAKQRKHIKNIELQFFCLNDIIDSSKIVSIVLAYFSHDK